MQGIINILVFVGLLLGLTLITSGLYLGVKLLKKRLDEKTFELLKEHAQMIVEAVEQLFDYQGAGEEKRKKAIEYLMKKFNLTQEEAEILVEYAVKQMKDFLKF